MCGRYQISRTDELADRYSIKSELLGVKPRYNIAPTQKLPVILPDGELQIMRWGLIPFWAKDEKIGYKMINARAESVAEKPSFKKLLETQRCIVPATGFYEWKKNPEGKQPYYIFVKDERIFSFAGLYSKWKTPNREEVNTYTIITTQANSMMEKIHNRMPVILKREDEERWLNPDTVEPEHLQEFLVPYKAEAMDAYPISSEINKPMNDYEGVYKMVNSQ